MKSKKKPAVVIAIGVGKKPPMPMKKMPPMSKGKGKKC